MKMSVSTTFAVFGMVFLSSMIMNGASVWSLQKDDPVRKPIPSRVMMIAEKTCVKCHTDWGNRKAMMYFNMSKWDKFSPKKQASKAKDMCKMVSKGEMPPKDFMEKHPGSAPTKDEVKIICDWATSIRIVKK